MPVAGELSVGMDDLLCRRAVCLKGVIPFGGTLAGNGEERLLGFGMVSLFQAQKSLYTSCQSFYPASSLQSPYSLPGELDTFFICHPIPSLWHFLSTMSYAWNAEIPSLPFLTSQVPLVNSS